MTVLLLASAGIVILILLLHDALVHFRFFQLKQKVKNDPFIGKKEEDNNYYYKEEGYTVSYKIKEIPAGVKTVEWVFLKRRLTFPEEKFLKTKRFFRDLFLYQRWAIVFRPPFIFVLAVSIVIFYFGLVQTQKARIDGLKWVVAGAAGVSPSQIQYIGKGWLQVSGNRKTATDRINEPIRYAFNPFSWFLSSDSGLVRRWRGKSYGYVTYPVAFNDSGDVWMSKEGTWRHGRLDNSSILKWDTPQGSRKVTEQELTVQDKKLHVQDK